MKAYVMKDDKIIKAYDGVLSVKIDGKYKYFIIHQKLYHHSIQFIIRFNECDEIRIKEHIDFKEQIKVIKKND